MQMTPKFKCQPESSKPTLTVTPSSDFAKVQNVPLSTSSSTFFKLPLLSITLRPDCIGIAKLEAIDTKTNQKHSDLTVIDDKVIPNDKSIDQTYNFYVQVTVPNKAKSVFTTHWTRVRHVPAGNTWHPATDMLEGTEEYGDPSDDSMAWSIKWDKT